jgi:hypothetical protein
MAAAGTSPRRCAGPGCGRFVGGGAIWCRRHAGAAGGTGAGGAAGGFAGRAGAANAGDDALARYLGQGQDQDQDQDRDQGDDGVRVRFLARVRAGEYRALAEEGLAETVARAAQGPGLAAEIGMVRVALARLLEEEPDAGRFATGVARLVAVAVQAARVERAGAGAEDADLAALVAALRRELG